ncbi:C2H2-type zinc finger protein [Halorientalis halophila]|uniref:C2H2-type zinc finger protein n=1 Tax=Halorientalis halophila TaxID=3108499 RepID=UPI0030080EEF
MTDTETPRTNATDRPDGSTSPPAPDEYEVPPGDEPVVCTHCGAPFADADLLALHRGIEHAAALDEAEREAFDDAYEAESEALRLFRLQALGALVMLYFGLLMAYAVFA